MGNLAKFIREGQSNLWPYSGYFGSRSGALEWFNRSGLEKAILCSIDDADDLRKHVNLAVLPVQNMVLHDWIVVTMDNTKALKMNTTVLYWRPTV